MFYKYIVLFLFTFFNFLQSQDRLSIKEIDSLTNVLYDKRNRLYNDKGLVLAKEILARSKDINYSNGQIRSLVKIVDIKIANLDYRSGYDYLKTLKKISFDNKDYQHYVAALGMESKLYFNEGNFDRAVNILNSAKVYIPYIQNIDDRINSRIINNIYMWFAIYNNVDQKVKQVSKLRVIAQELYDDSSVLQDLNKRRDRTLMACNLLIRTLILEKSFSEAYLYQKEAEKYINEVGLNTFVGVDYLKAKADLLYNDNTKSGYNVDDILAAYQHALKVSEGLGYHAANNEMYPIMAKLYGRKKDSAKQVEFLEKANLSERRINERSKKSVQDLRDILYAAPNAEVNTKNIQMDNLIYWFLLLAFVVAVGYYVYRQKKGKVKIEYNALMEEDGSVVEQADVISHLLTLAHENNSSFLVSFMSAYPDFSKALLSINSTMKNTDIEFCAYIKLNLNTKQIAVIKNMSVRAVEGKKYRIRKKLEIPSNENMYLWISKI